MNTQIVIMPGSNRVDLPLLRAAAQDFGWAVETARNVGELVEMRDQAKIGALLFQQDSLGSGGSWLETIEQLKIVAPEVRLVACNHFSEAADYPKLCRSGLFHSVWLPLKLNEVRQCLGFIWEAEKRLSLVPRKAVTEIEKRRTPLIARAAS